MRLRCGLTPQPALNFTSTRPRLTISRLASQCRQPHPFREQHMKRSMPGVLLIMLFGAPRLVVAGPFADDMAKCIVNSASPQDRTLFVKWIFTVIALHPDLSSMSNVSAKQREDIARSAGTLLQRLLLESCRSQTQQALRNEGTQTIQYAFQVLGQVATQGLFTDSHVMEGAKAFAKYVDEEQLKALAKPDAGK